MTLLSVTHTPLVVSPVSDRLWHIVQTCVIAMATDEGVIRITLKPGFTTDFRSPHGILGDIVDIFVPGVGTEPQACCFAFHDACYSMNADGEHPVSREIADYLLRDSLKLSGMSGATADLVYDAVHLLGQSPYDAPTDYGNSSLFPCSWDAR